MMSAASNSYLQYKTEADSYVVRAQRLARSFHRDLIIGLWFLLGFSALKLLHWMLTGLFLFFLLSPEPDGKAKLAEILESNSKLLAYEIPAQLYFWLFSAQLIYIFM